VSSRTITIFIGGIYMSQKLDRYRNAVWTLLGNMPNSWLPDSKEVKHYSKGDTTFFEVDFALGTYGYNYDLTIAVNKITCQSAIVNKKGEDVTEKYRALFREILEEDFLD